MQLQSAIDTLTILVAAPRSKAQDAHPQSGTLSNIPVHNKTEPGLYNESNW